MIYMAGFACDNALRAVFSSLFRRPFPGPHGPDSAESRGVPTGAVVSPVVAQRQVPMVSLTMEIIQLQLIELLTCPLICVYRCLTWSRLCRKRGVRTGAVLGQGFACLQQQVLGWS